MVDHPVLSTVMSGKTFTICMVKVFLFGGVHAGEKESEQ
jgi:hypothetical protein